MLYLIKSAAYDENNNLFFALKIGFTDDWNKRRVFYETHNPNTLK